MTRGHHSGFCGRAHILCHARVGLKLSFASADDRLKVQEQRIPCSQRSEYNSNPQIKTSNLTTTSMSSNTNKILILVIGATGAQGQAVVKALLNPDARGNASPYSVRALTRDPTSKHALKLASLGVECVEGSLEDLHSVAQAMEGAYGAWVNTDGFTVGEIQEMVRYRLSIGYSTLIQK
ncbi:hypothetical protein B0H15DRAFT_61606 [Mycena belliarum]|uniref:NmrA-like domain-containing protein n=1 Tax=Mycena belliarum TaxID=1033014 RepID=A0AAD6TND1_9AGAR|nr:hypothetical protein B0H15DRAFT_61606 [Mycena belliae]